jgi:hypothetical protein
MVGWGGWWNGQIVPFQWPLRRSETIEEEEEEKEEEIDKISYQIYREHHTYIWDQTGVPVDICLSLNTSFN